MTNKEKAQEICARDAANCCRDCDNCEGGREFYNLVEMAEWKDEQYAKAFASILIELDELKHQVKSLLP